MLFIIFIIIVVALLVFAQIRNRKISKEGIMVKAKISRIEKNESLDDDNVSYHCYVAYVDESGNRQEAMILNKLNQRYEMGQELTIRYLPDKKQQAIVVK